MYVREVLFHVRLYMAAVVTNFTFCPLNLNISCAPCKSFSFHSIAVGHLTHLNYLKTHYRVSDMIYCVGSIFCSVSQAVTLAIPRKAQIIALQIIEYGVLFSLPKYINYWKVLNGIKGFITQKTQS